MLANNTSTNFQRQPKYTSNKKDIESVQDKNYLHAKLIDIYIYFSFFNTGKLSGTNFKGFKQRK